MEKGLANPWSRKKIRTAVHASHGQKTNPNIPSSGTNCDRSANLMRIPWIKPLLALILAGVLPASRVMGQTNVSIAFLSDEFSVFDVDAPPTATRQFNFTLPAGPGSFPDLTSIYQGTVVPVGDLQTLNPNSPEAAADTPYTFNEDEFEDQSMGANLQTVDCPQAAGPVYGLGGVGLRPIMDMFVMTQDNLADELANRVVTNYAAFSYINYTYQDVDVNFKIQGGPFNGKVIPLHGRMASGYGQDPSDDPSEAEDWGGQMLIALNWGIDPLGNTNYVLINLVFTAGANTEDSDCLPLQNVCEYYFGGDSVASYFGDAWQSLQAQLGNGQMYLSGAIPELLYLYDYSGNFTVPPAHTMPSQWLTYSTVLDMTNLDYPGYTNIYQIANQYNAGLAYNLPIRFNNMKGGNACGPTSLGMMLNAYPVCPVNPVLDYDNTLQLGTNVPAKPPSGTAQGFTWGGRAYEWLVGHKSPAGSPPFSAPSPLPFPSPKIVWEREATADLLGDPALGKLWHNIDQLLYNGQPVEIRTDLGVGTSPGGGHCILLLGISFNPDLPKIYGSSISGNYYIVADPAGHYFGNSTGTHYATIDTLIQQNAGINYGGWYGIYPKELLQQRISDQDSTNDNYRMEALTLGDPIVPRSVRTSAHSPVAMMITDPLGRQSGLLPDDSIVLNIPSSHYQWAAIDEEEQGVSYFDPLGPKTINIDDPIDGV